HRVTSINEAPDRVTVTASRPGGQTEQFEASEVVVTAGAWSEPLLAGLAVAEQLPPLRVTEEHPAHFSVQAGFGEADFDETGPDEAAGPSFTHLRHASELAGYARSVYGMVRPGEGVKVGFHATGDTVDPDQRRFR